jgi:hypothetical protein
MSVGFVSLGRVVVRSVVNIMGDAITVEVLDAEELVGYLEPVDEIIGELDEI